MVIEGDVCNRFTIVKSIDIIVKQYDPINNIKIIIVCTYLEEFFVLYNLN